MPDANPPRSLSPFRDSFNAYRKAKWFGTLPLPARKKNPPPTGFTGHAAPFPSPDDIRGWLGEPERKRANIALRLGGVDKEYEVIGIDVDHYVKGDKEKRGGEQLQALENAHGPLPPTWISSARTDGVSGIRYYRVPRGLAFRGQVSKDIECIQKGHRFAVVWPSYNPDSKSDYWWFPPDADLTPEGRKAWRVGELPVATELPLLPETWLKFLTRGLMEAGKVEIDMDSTVDDIYAWAYEKFGVDEAVCFRMREKADKHIKLIREEATSHDKIVNAHMNIMLLASEGHKGWDTAIHEIEAAFVDEVQKRDKRSIDELRGEVFRSRINGLRKVKAKVDARIAIGAEGVPATDLECGSTDDQGVPLLGSEASPPDNNLFDIPRKQSSPASEYRQNDDGNADHFIDIWSDANMGPAVRYVKGLGWIIWHKGDHDQRQPHWEVDEDGRGTMRQMFRAVRDKQEGFAENLKVDYTNAMRAFAQQTPGVSAADVREAKSAWSNWHKFATSSGMNRNADNAIAAIATHAGINLDINEIDARPDLLAVANGVVELNPTGARLRDAEPEDYLTLNTGVPWLHPKEIPNTGQKLWQEYLDKFLPDPSYRRDVQIILGHALIGSNPHKKLIIFKGAANTGKSVMITMINEVLGDYAKTTNRSLFTYHKLNPVLAQALPKRVVSIVELSRDKRNPLTVDQMKTATGNDYIEAELKGKNATINRVPMFLPIMVTNTVPEIEGHDKALRERLRVISFNVVEQNPDDTIAARMRRESRTAVLNWLIEGYNLYCQSERKFPENDRMRADTDEFASDMDDISLFAKECLKPAPNMDKPSINWARDQVEWCTSRAAVWTRYEQWLFDNHIPEKHKLTSPQFTRRLKELGFNSPQNKVRVNKQLGYYWLGVKLIGHDVSRDVQQITGSSSWQNPGG
ncbi:DNA primase [Mycobacterium phage Barnyard]|uniref:SF3 helicase domain-containing protein n=1 Tax=Mycobacterium phage Barnyard TaxID=205880 RepID=Q855W4_9CAUD|nr:DNA primase [Mycobacterium phage Barnyard]AAN02162.1 hypothetical protein PBI_BARNYARD_108 [Mycobacterium phage Barnyard]